MSLINAFESSKVENILEPPAKILETHISKVFLYENRVRKVYKHISDPLVGDLNDFKFRKKFFGEDFFWNQQMAPFVYLELVCVKKNGELWEKVDLPEAEDFYIEMLRVDDEKNLTNLLLADEVSDDLLKEIGVVMTERLEELSEEKRADLEDLFGKGWGSLLRARMVDLREFGYMAGSELEKSEVNRIMDKLDRFVAESEYLQNFDNSRQVVATDNHSDNILILDGQVSFIDVFLPKREWRVVDTDNNICRVGADVVATQGKAKVAPLYEGYKKIQKLGPPNVVHFYEVYNAFIKAAYYLMIGKKNLGDIYMKFVREEISSVEANP